MDDNNKRILVEKIVEKSERELVKFGVNKRIRRIVIIMFQIGIKIRNTSGRNERSSQNERKSKNKSKCGENGLHNGKYFQQD